LWGLVPGWWGGGLGFFGKMVAPGGLNVKLG